MSRIHVLVAAASSDMKAELISAAVGQRSDMILVANRMVQSHDIGKFLDVIPAGAHCALVVVGRAGETEQVAAFWVAQRKDLVVLGVDVVGDLVRIAVRDPGLDALLTALRDLVDRAGLLPGERISLLQLPQRPLLAGPASAPTTLAERPLLNAAIDWAHLLLRKAGARLMNSKPDQSTVTMTTAAIADFLDARKARSPLISDDGVQAADVALSQALENADPRSEPLARAATALGLDALEFRIVVLALAPELDVRHQRWIGLLMDDLTRRAGTLGLFAELLGEPSAVRRSLAASGKLSLWRLTDGGVPHADEPLRLDPPFRGWLLGEEGALADDARLRRLLRQDAWAGAGLVAEDGERAVKLLSAREAQWRVLASNHPAAQRALVEAGAAVLHQVPIRADLTAVRGLDPAEVEETGTRLARLAQLTGNPLVIDASGDSCDDDVAARAIFDAIGGTGCPGLVIAPDAARIVRLLGSASYVIETEDLPAASRVSALRAAAAGAGAPLTQEVAESVAARYPLQIDSLEHAMRLAQTGSAATRESKHEQFLNACKQVAAEGSSNLAQRIEPVFKLDDVVLPLDRKQQLEEIVDNVRLAPKVLDGWNFRAQLPYGRGVTALFHGPSGTGKTMAALAVAQKLGVQILHVDLSRVVSKFIGDTEKHVDKVFLDAETSGAALLIDEAEALLGKRSEVNDAHDRYANIEVAYLLQRMEAYEGLAILTTNLRQNVDAAFLRRLRFIVDFPRPDLIAREQIWRRCLPDESHVLDDAAFRQLARRIELTGGHVRQITLRAAFIAAAAGTKISLEHVAHACRAEFAKLGLPPVDVDFSEKRRAA